MKLGFTTLLATALAALLLVPAAGAGPGKGNGNGNGPPAWAGGGGDSSSGGAEAGGRPDWAGKPATKPDKPGRPDASEADDDQPRHANPAWICKFERDRMGAEAFAEDYGTNDNKANAFGMCVSLEAHERDGVEPVEDEETLAPEEGEAPAPGDDDPAEDEETGEDETASSVQAFFRYLWPVLYA